MDGNPYQWLSDGTRHHFSWNGKHHQHHMEMDLGMNIALEFYGDVVRFRFYATEWDRNPMNGPAKVTSSGMVQFPEPARICSTCKHRFELTRSPCPLGCGGETSPGGISLMPHPHRFWEFGPDDDYNPVVLLPIKGPSGKVGMNIGLVWDLDPHDVEGVTVTDCEKCPEWRPDETGSYNCRVRYCINDPMADAKAAADDHWDEMQAEYDAAEEENRQMAMADDREMQAFQEEREGSIEKW